MARWAFLNCQGIQNKLEEVKGLLCREKFGIMGLAETWLIAGQNVEIDGYRWIGAEREGVSGRGGVGVFVSNDYAVSIENFGLSRVKGIETVWINVGAKGMPTTLVGIVYISPRAKEIITFQEEMIEFVAGKQREGSEVVLMGDFNAHFNEEGVGLDCRASLLCRTNTVLGLAVLNWLPVAKGKFTWEGGSKRSTLDYVLASEAWVERIDHLLVDEEGWFDVGSDHNILFWAFGKEKRGARQTQKDKHTKGINQWRWNTKGSADWERYTVVVETKLTRFAEEMVEEREEGEWTAAERFEKFTHYLNEAAEESLERIECGKGKRKMKRWWDGEVKEAIKRRKQTCRDHRKSRALHQRFPGVIKEEMVNEKWTEYQKQKRIAKDLVRKKRDEEREAVLEDARSKGGYNSAVFWKSAKKRGNKGPTSLKDKTGKLCEDEDDMAEIAREHFEGIGKGCISQEGVGQKQKETEKDKGQNAGECLGNLGDPLLYEEMKAAIKRMKRGKGVGVDKFNFEMLEKGGEILWRNLYTLLQCCWEEEYVPNEWMEGIIVPLHKGGKTTDIGNYRGITLGSHVGKLFCQILKTRLSRVVEGQRILSEAQGGFRKNRQTVDQLFVVNGISQLRRSKGQKTWLAFLDLRKAFPSVWREGLWKKMDRYGLGGKFLRVCRMLYSNTKARVRLGSALSRSFDIPTGLREGCVLSPLLFSIFIMDLAEELESKGLGVKIKGHWMGACFFADDIVLVATSAHELQAMLDVVADYADSWRIRFNTSKCGVLVVGQRKQKRWWKLGKENILEVDEYKYLGVWLNRQANGLNHVRHLIEKTSSLHAIVRGAKFWQGEEDVEAGAVVWNAVCKPVLDYGSEVWACSSLDSEKKLEQVQDRAGRVLLGLSWRFPGVAIRGDLGWPKLKFSRHCKALKFMGRVRAMEKERWTKIVGEAVIEYIGRGTLADYGLSLIEKYGLSGKWNDGKWNEKAWTKIVRRATEDAGKAGWAKEVAVRRDLGPYKEKQKELGKAEYVKGRNGNVIRAEIKQRVEWGQHWE